MANARRFKWWGIPARRPQNGNPKTELDQLGREPFESYCKMSSKTEGIGGARYLRGFITPITSPRGASGGLAPRTKV